ncbi:MAG: hypothetical protein JWM21_1470 [Acidobacteria bacterium]|nr:hypothetical protein [Acidobacteriota bacterium]
MKTPGAQAIALLIALGIIWGAATVTVAAPVSLSKPRRLPPVRKVVRPTKSPAHRLSIPRSVTFRNSKDRGLLVKVWINDTGPYTFAVDTGAGITLIGDRVAASAATERQGTTVALGGLSGVVNSRGRTTVIRGLAIGDPANLLRANQKAIVIDNLPAEIDGVLDPTDAYSPLGYSIDMPGHEIAAFDPRNNPLSINDVPDGGAVVRWVAGSSQRPFVRLGDGRLALIDTGSGFGLAVSQDLQVQQNRRPGVLDLGGGAVASRRAAPSTISIGSLTLRGVPTDILTGAERDAPILLGRDALYPFRLTFDPLQRLIEIAPAQQ